MCGREGRPDESLAMSLGIFYLKQSVGVEGGGRRKSINIREGKVDVRCSFMMINYTWLWIYVESISVSHCEFDDDEMLQQLPLAHF